MLLNMKEIVLVVGGGIAGLETARELKELGLTPVIVEKSSSLGGHVAHILHDGSSGEPAGDRGHRSIL